MSLSDNQEEETIPPIVVYLRDIAKSQNFEQNGAPMRTLEDYRETNPERWSQVLAFKRVWKGKLSTFDDKTGLFDLQKQQGRWGYPFANYYVSFDENQDLGKFSITLPINMMENLNATSFNLSVWNSADIEPKRILWLRFRWEKSGNTWILKRRFKEIGPCNKFTIDVPNRTVIVGETTIVIDEEYETSGSDIAFVIECECAMWDFLLYGIE